MEIQSFPIWAISVALHSFTVFSHQLQSCLTSSRHLHLIFKPHVMLNHLRRHTNIIRYLRHIGT